MHHHPIRYALLVMLLLSWAQLACGSNEQEKGRFPVYSFSPRTYAAADQNFSVLQDQRGVMYFGNNYGILEYDGVNWNLIEVTNTSAVRSMDMDRNGRIYVGAVDDLGYLEPDPYGKLRFISLLHLIDEEKQSFADVWNTYVTDRGVFFQCDEYVFVYADDSIRVLTTESAFKESFYVRGHFYARINDIGMTLLEDGRFIPLEGCESIKNQQVWGLTTFDEQTLMLATPQDIFLYRISDTPGKGILKKFPTEAGPFFTKHEINSLVSIHDSLFSVGTWGGGIVVLDKQGRIYEYLNKSLGLADDIVYNQYLDDRNNLWLALSHGISRVEILSPLSSFSDASGLTGSIQSITRFNNSIYVATLAGLFYQVRQREITDDRIIINPRFELIEDLAMESWDLLTFSHNDEEILLVVTNYDIMEVNKENEVSILPVDYVPYDLYQSSLVPGRVYIGLESGLASIYRDDGEWIDEGTIEGISENVNQMSEDLVGNLWMGTPSDGALKLNILSLDDDRIDEIKVTKFDTTHGLPEGPTIVSQITGPSVVATSKGLYKYNPVENWFKPDTTYGAHFADGSHYIHRISEYPDKGIWMVTYSDNAKYTEDRYKAGYLKPTATGDYEWVTEPFVRITEEILHAIHIDLDRIIWLGGNGLHRFDFHQQENFRKGFNTLISKVSLGTDSIIFGGTNYNDSGYVSLIQPEQLDYTLPYRYNSLIFNYAAQTGEDESFLRFSYLLEGFDQKWSDWSEVTYKEYTNLREGNYTFRVKAKNAFNQEGQEATFSFSVMPPWYRTIIAYIAYVILLTAAVYTIVKVYTRQLRAIIRERTAEVVMQKEEIEMKNQEITDSIQYASRIQSAVLPKGDTLDEYLPDRFILYLPRDIVSGDFYWMYVLNSKVITVAADCTGHGVPGAFMSMLGVAFLNEIVSKVTDIKANEILNQLRSHVIKSLHQTGAEGESKDGMDIALCVYDLKKMKLEFSGANNPLYLIRDGELITYKPDKMPIGIHEFADRSFTLNEIDIKKGDCMYTFSDGYADQFGGPRGKKFMSKRMKQLLVDIHNKDMEYQMKHLKDTLFDWMKNTEQVDDVIVMGVRV